jgi:hypothetical protein
MDFNLLSRVSRHVSEDGQVTAIIFRSGGDFIVSIEGPKFSALIGADSLEEAERYVDQFVDCPSLVNSYLISQGEVVNELA